MVFLSIPKGLPPGPIRFFPFFPWLWGEMPPLLVVATIRMGSGLAGRDDQIRQVEKSPSAVPASPPVTTVMPRPPARLFAMAVPGAIEYCTSIGLDTGTTFHSLREKCPTKFRPPE